MNKNDYPVPPPKRLICQACGNITETGHTNWMCKFIIWLDKD